MTLPDTVFEQLARDKEFYDSLLTHQRRALIGQVGAYWKLARDLTEPKQADLLDLDPKTN